MSELTPTPTTAKAFADAARFPGEDDATAMRRRITMHEYLMTGGVLMGTENGKAVYSDPITVAHLGQGSFEQCPWHGEDCTAWEAIRAGDGVWTKLEAELWSLQENRSEHGGVEVAERIANLQDELSLRPIQVRTERPAARERVIRDSVLEKKIAKQAGKKKPEDARDVAFKNLRGSDEETISFEGNEEEE